MNEFYTKCNESGKEKITESAAIKEDVINEQYLN